MSEKLRWQYRFDNYRRAYTLLQEAVERVHNGETDQLAKDGTIRRFEFTMELSWKVMKDYLEHQGINFVQVTPGMVIKEAFAGKLISDGETWMIALDTRNKRSHTYTAAEFEKTLQLICTDYMQCFGDLHDLLAAEYE